MRVDFTFDINKTVSSAGYLARRCGGEIKIFFLMKMMYGAEREALATWRRPITGDSFCSMKSGPILSRTYNLFKGEIANDNSDMIKWFKHFAPRRGNDLKLISEPDFEFLSELEVQALENSCNAIADLVKQKGMIADTLHTQWPEWQYPSKYGRGSIPLRLEEVLSEVIEDESEVERIVLEIRAVNSARAALQVS